MKAPVRPSMRQAINAMCRDCIFDPMDRGNWRQQVEACTTPSCPLFELRPVSRSSAITEATTRRARTQDAVIPINGEALGGEP